MNAGLMAANVGAMAYYFIDPSLTAGLSMLGATTAMSAIMGVTLTMAIGGTYIFPVLFFVSCILIEENFILVKYLLSYTCDGSSVFRILTYYYKNTNLFVNIAIISGVIC